MIKLTLEDIPEEAVDEVKEMAATAVERYYKRAVVASEAIRQEFETKVDSFRAKNKLEKKFEIELEENEKN